MVFFGRQKEICGVAERICNTKLQTDKKMRTQRPDLIFLQHRENLLYTQGEDLTSEACCACALFS